MNNILNYLDEMFPYPKCELNYNNDFELLIAIVLSAQTTDKRVNSVTKELFKKYPTAKELSNASISDIERIIMPVGTYKKKSVYINEIAKSLLFNNFVKIPADRNYLETLPGVGRKTINVFLSEAYNIPNIAVDTHVFRVCKRLGITNENDDVLATEMVLMRKIKKVHWSKVHLQLVLFGRYHCKAIKPLCENCKVIKSCLYYKKK
ncbi:MAG: endonuclease III [bacterium]|nr:endonuclease III [bacterium]